jgi:hypothetical protein
MRGARTSARRLSRRLGPGVRGGGRGGGGARGGGDAAPAAGRRQGGARGRPARGRRRAGAPPVGIFILFEGSSLWTPGQGLDHQHLHLIRRVSEHRAACKKRAWTLVPACGGLRNAAERPALSARGRRAGGPGGRAGVAGGGRRAAAAAVGRGRPARARPLRSCLRSRRLPGRARAAAVRGRRARAAAGSVLPSRAHG